jgi:hypothetical protein
MNDFILKATDTTPVINFNANSGELLIEGKLIPEDAKEFFEPILSWLDEYVKTDIYATKLKLKLHYFNVSSSKNILYIFYTLNNLIKRERLVEIEWYYSIDEDEMYELGQDFALMVNIPFKFIEYDLYKEISI